MTSADLIGWRQARPEQIGYYVSVIDGRRRGALLGPYGTHDEALENVQRGRNLAYDADPRSHWYAFGTCKVTSRNLPQSTFGV